MNLEGHLTRLRALEPADIDLLYEWENDPEIWSVSGTLAPFSHNILSKFIEEQQFDIYQTRQLRLVIETREGSVVGTVDLFEFDPQHRRAGVGILIHDSGQRGKGYASDALQTLIAYAREVLGLHQLWCNIGVDNTASLALFRRAGFTRIGVKRDWQWRSDGYRDEVMMQTIL